jgi:DNA-binding GntR family transcriptional regulator
MGEHTVPIPHETDVSALAETSKIPVHEVVYRRLREMVLFGELSPGQPVTIQGLVSTLDTGITPVREAIRRLTAERALSATDNRRISVPQLSALQLSHLSFARCTIEPQLALLAAEKITSAQINHLESLDQSLDQAIKTGDVQAYLQLNYRFHRALYEISQAEILLSISDALWLRVGPSLRSVCGLVGTLNLPDKHEEAIAAMRNHDPNAVALAIKEDIEQGHSQIARTLI